MHRHGETSETWLKAKSKVQNMSIKIPICRSKRKSLQVILPVFGKSDMYFLWEYNRDAIYLKLRMVRRLCFRQWFLKGRRREPGGRGAKGDSSAIFMVHFDLEVEFFNYMYYCIYNFFFSYPLKIGPFLDLKHLQIVTRMLQNILIEFMEGFFPPFSFFIKS